MLPDAETTASHAQPAGRMLSRPGRTRRPARRCAPPARPAAARARASRAACRALRRAFSRRSSPPSSAQRSWPWRLMIVGRHCALRTCLAVCGRRGSRRRGRPRAITSTAERLRRSTSMPARELAVQRDELVDDDDQLERRRSGRSRGSRRRGSGWSRPPWPAGCSSRGLHAGLGVDHLRSRSCRRSPSWAGRASAPSRSRRG